MLKWHQVNKKFKLEVGDVLGVGFSSVVVVIPVMTS